MRRLPSLRGLQAFEAVARTANLATAAQSLGISPSAVSHRLRGLEEEIGLRLFERTPQGLVPTEAGRRYKGAVGDAFEMLARATDELLGHDPSRPLTISMTTEFGIRWLMPRFHRFRALHPDIDTAMLSTYQLADLSAGEADLALRHGDGAWPGLRSEPIIRFAVSPLCAPRLAREIAGLAPAEALARCTLIRADYDDWDVWLEAAGAAGVAPRRQLQFADYSMAVAAAIDGEGLVLGYSGYVESETTAGALVQPYELVVQTRKGYHLVYLDARLADPNVRAFRDWVRSERDATGPERSYRLFPDMGPGVRLG